MNLFSKEKGIILSLLNAVLIIWILGAIISTIYNLTPLLVRDHVYTYEEYEIMNCDLDYETEEECKESYIYYELDTKYLDPEYKRSIIISVSNIILVSTTLVILNKNKKKKTD